MAGHSKWKQIKLKKGVADARRGQAFTKLAREITVAAKLAGPDPDSNFRLRLAIQKARAENMPNENIKRALDRATAEGGGENYDELYYEGYGPDGAAIMVKALTDNRNRTVGEIRSVFTRAGGNLGESGSVNFLFDQVGIVTVSPDGEDVDDLMLQAIDAGARDVKADEGTVEVVTEPAELKRVQDALTASGLRIEDASITMQPKAVLQLEDESAMKVVRLLERLEDLDDVQEVYSNVDISDAVLERV